MCINCNLSLYLIGHLEIKTWRWEAMISFRLLTHYQYSRVCRHLAEFACLNVFWVWKSGWADLKFLRCVSVLWVYGTSWAFRGSIPARDNRFFSFHKRPDRLWDPPTPCSVGFGWSGLFPRRQSGLGVELSHSTPSSTEVKNKKSYTGCPESFRTFKIARHCVDLAGRGKCCSVVMSLANWVAKTALPYLA